MSSTSIQEENRHPDYDPGKYYPARLGETISKQYRLVSKLGWGANSTVWLAKDITRWVWQPTRYVTLKITNCGIDEQRSAREEVEISQRISKIRSNHEGRRYVRLVRESFSIPGASGDHLCLVFEPLREPLWVLGKHLGSNGVPPAVLKPFLKLLLQGLDFLHSECHIIHTDLKADNFLVGFEEPGVLARYARQQEDSPAPVSDHGGRPVFQSRPDFGPLRKGVGLVQISDFSAAVFGDVPEPHNHDIQPQPFCAPEVLLKATWSYSADIWNLGIMPGNSTYSRAKHIAQMVRLLGPPPLQLLERADQGIRGKLFTNHGEFRFPSLVPPEDFNLASLTPFLDGEDKRLFLGFVGKMLRWEPGERATAAQLYNDPWLDFRA
ncbi:Protein kinase protein [Aspergillus mulundensis]|uniref:non-specific serine/threonine protein kinase n=1 Tax=Aspergillus mulundensis TaxID=1810919 RepID=A0A3D8QN14_9EURO|nr:Protein kinase protein [Aspergillus mulundensis]RDW63050.1 Protein kinase protein [Aspergillus mulundensis]